MGFCVEMGASVDSTTGLIVFGALFGIAASLAIIGGFVQTAIIGEVNRKLPGDSQFSYFGGHIVKAVRLRREYQRLYPEGKLVRVFDLTTVMSMIITTGK